MSFFFKNTNPDRHFRDVIDSGFNEDNKEVMIIKAPLTDFNTNTRVVVDSGELAIFVQKGEIVQVIEPSMQVVKTGNYPFFTNFFAILQDGRRSNVCALYFIRTVNRPVEWGTSTTRAVADPQLERVIAELGGRIIKATSDVGSNGTFTVSTNPKGVQRFFSSFVGGFREAYTYQDLSIQLQPEMTALFQDCIERIVKENGSVDGINPRDVAKAMTPGMEEIAEKIGLTLKDFTVAEVIVHDSPGSKKLKEDVIKDYQQRLEIMSGAIEKKLVRKAEAEGKKEELLILGDHWLKVKAAELAETALKNSAISQIGTSALGGFLGTHTDVLGDMLRGFVNTLGGKNGMGTGETGQGPEDPTPDMYTPVNAGENDGTSSAPDNGDSKDRLTVREVALKRYTELFIKGAISKKAYDQMTAELLKET